MALNLHRGPEQGGIREVVEENQTATTEDIVAIAGTGDVTHTFGSLRRLLGKSSVEVQVEGGYTANVQSVSGNDVTFRVYQCRGSSGEHNVSGGTSITYNIKGRGY